MHFGERFNSITHLVGTVLSVAGLATLVTMGALEGDPYKVVSFAVYGAMLFVLYAISTLYHWVRSPRVKAVLQKCDHSAIYLLIAGSYTPFTLVTLRGPWGWSLFGVSWGLAAPRHRAGTHARAPNPQRIDGVLRVDGLARARSRPSARYGVAARRHCVAGGRWRDL